MKKYISAFLLVMIVLLVPCGVGAAAGYITHTVVRGDTMWRLSRTYGVSLDDVIASNPHIKDPHWIYPGDVIYIPGSAGDGGSAAEYEAEVARLVNEIRREHGLKALAFNGSLSNVARIKSEDMRENNYFSHQSPTYGSPFEMMKKFGIKYNTAGENIAKGYSTPRAVVDGWMNSEGHRANILRASFTEIGVGYVSDGNYWTQMFIG